LRTGIAYHEVAVFAQVAHGQVAAELVQRVFGMRDWNQVGERNRFAAEARRDVRGDCEVDAAVLQGLGRAASKLLVQLSRS